MARVESLIISGDPDRWRALGLTVTDDGLIPLFGTSLRVVATGHGDAFGIVGWELSGLGDDVDESVDGLRTAPVAPRSPMFAEHDLGAIGLDHLVVLTGDLERTSNAIESATGCELKRVREVGAMRQGFHRIGGGGLIVEIVERPEVVSAIARFWGLVINVEDLDAACALLGDERIGAAKEAVQPGRRIATFRDAAELGLPVALMTP